MCVPPYTYADRRSQDHGVADAVRHPTKRYVIVTWYHISNASHRRRRTPSSAHPKPRTVVSVSVPRFPSTGRDSLNPPPASAQFTPSSTSFHQRHHVAGHSQTRPPASVRQPPQPLIPPRIQRHAQPHHPTTPNRTLSPPTPPPIHPRH